MDTKKIKVLLTKATIDSHDRGVRAVVKALMDEGMEVVFTQYKIPDEIVSSAQQEDVDVIGISFSSGGQVRVSQEVLRLLKEQDMGDSPLIVGGSIPPYDVPKLMAMGVSGVFRGGVRLEQIVNHIRICMAEKGKS